MRHHTTADGAVAKYLRLRAGQLYQQRVGLYRTAEDAKKHNSNGRAVAVRICVRRAP